MASLGLNLGFSFSKVQIQHPRNVSGSGRARVISCNSSSASQASSPQQGISAATPPEIELEFFGVTIGAIFALNYDPIRFKTQKRFFVFLCTVAEAGERRVVSGG